MTHSTLQHLVQTTEKSIKDFFKSMCHLPLHGEAVIYNPTKENLPAGFDIVGIISLTGDLKGSFALHTTKVFAEKITNQLLKTDKLPHSHAIFDTIGESANIITGGAKTEANALYNIDFEMSVPTVLQGQNLLVEPLKGNHAAMIQFKSKEDDLMILISLAGN